jgi:DNA-binding transcriptional MocR family regulator
LYAKSQARLKPSAIREILKITRRPGIISFAGGVPDPKLFPFQQLEAAQQAVLKNNSVTAYQYGISQGCEELVIEIASLATSLERPTQSENILVTNGSQQGLDFVARLFLNEGDSIAVTRPCYLGALQAFAPMNPKFLEVRCDEDGPVLEDLKIALKAKPKFFYLVPAFQNPTGQSVSVHRAKEILTLCRDAKVPIIEDAAYEGLYYEDRPQSLRSLEAVWLADSGLTYNQSGNVIFLGTFSKVIAPGFRIGWIEAPEQVASSLVVIKQGSDLHSSSINQLIVAYFLKNYAQTYWVDLRKAYTRKRDVMLNLVETVLGSQLSYFSRPKGGLFIWIEAKRQLDFGVLLNAAVEQESVAYVPGAPFFASNPQHNSMRISFATASEEEMAIGIKKLSKLMETAEIIAA